MVSTVVCRESSDDNNEHEDEIKISLKINLCLSGFLVVAGGGLDGDTLCSRVCDHNVVR